MIQIDCPKPSKVFNKQIYLRLESYETRIEVYYGGASSGKSQGVYQKVVWKAMKSWRKPRKVVVLRKVSASLLDSSWQHIKDVLEQFKILEFCAINKTEKVITLPNGATILFKGLDDPEKIKSIKGVSDFVLEEASEFTQEDFEQINLRLRDREHVFKQVFLMFNPISKKNWVHQYFFDDGVPKKLEDIEIIWSTYKHNRFLDDATIKYLEGMRDRNPAYYRIYALGEFATLDKLVLPNFTKRIISADEIKNLPQFNGLDFGYINDPSALLMVRYDARNKKIFITKEYGKKGMLNDAIAKMLHDMGIHKEIIFADSQEKKSIEEIRLLDVPRIRAVRKDKGSVMQGIQWLLQHEIIIDERCFQTIIEFENYTYKKDKKTGEYINEPVDTFNHYIDALRYALSEFILGHGQIQTSSAGDLGL